MLIVEFNCCGELLVLQNVTVTSTAPSQQSVIEKVVIVRVMQISPVKNVIVVLLDFMISRIASDVHVWLLALKE